MKGERRAAIFVRLVLRITSRALDRAIPLSFLPGLAATLTAANLRDDHKGLAERREGLDSADRTAAEGQVNRIITRLGLVYTCLALA